MSKNFKFAFSKWLEWLQNEKRISINTFDAYERDLTKWSEFTTNSNNPKKKDFRSYMGYLLEKKNSRASIARKISSIRNFYKFASQRNFLSCDDIDLIKSPKLPQSLPRSISNEQASTLIDSIGNGRPDWEAARDKGLIFLMYGAGLRISEALSIKKNQCPGAPTNRSKIHRKSTSKGTKIEVWRGPGGVQDASWAVLSVWIAFLAFLVGLGCVLWPKDKMEPKSHRNRCQN